MLKKTLFLIAPLAPLAAVAAIASSPTPAIGDTICPPGTNGFPTPCVVRCVVPHVVGRTLVRAKARIIEHNCKVGKVRRVGKTHRKGYRKVARIVVKQQPKGGTILPNHSKVNLRWRWKFRKIKHKK